MDICVSLMETLKKSYNRNGKRQNALERAVNRVAPASVPALLLALAKLDALSKGLGRGDAWDALTDVALTLCGKPLFATA